MRAPDFWRRDGGRLSRLVGLPLMPLGMASDMAARLQRRVVRPYRAPVPVVCVGNLVAGGAGKTPVVLSLLALFGAPFNLHVVMRGYGGCLAGPLRVDPARHDAAMVGDEPLLVAARAPCWIARDRAAGVRAAAAAGADAIILDDGFQSPAVAKDCSLVVIDAEYAFGNGRLIPAGPLRERPLPGLARAQAVVLLGDGPPPAEVAAARLPVLRAALRPLDGGRFVGRPVVAFAGIGRPEKFFATLRGLGSSLVAAVPFPDHHRFGAGDIAALRAQAEGAGASLVTTAKDHVRLPSALRAEIEVLEVEIDWQDRPALAHLLADVLPTRPEHRPRPAAAG